MRYVTFGQNHRHVIKGTVFDKDCVAIVDGDRDKVFELFGPKFCFEYSEADWDESKLEYFPRGYVSVDDKYHSKEWKDEMCQDQGLDDD